jgi:sugar O-acyltransferase (sialic acid O-acetyltransferase NeuD family)
MNKPIFILSAGGHAKVLLECLIALGLDSIHAFIEIENEKIGHKIAGIETISEGFFLEKYKSTEVLLVNGLGSVDLPRVRKKVFQNFKKRGYKFLTLVHPGAYVATDVVLGEGCQILVGSILQTGTIIQENVIVNTGAIIDHDCRIGAHSHIAPGVTLSGGIIIGYLCHIGTAATIVQNVQISPKCVVAAGSVVISNLNMNSRVAGVPAKLMK